MADVETVAVAEPGNDLTKQPNSFFLWQWPILGNIVEKFTSFNILKDKVPAD